MELSDKLFARLVYIYYTSYYTLSVNAYVACQAYGEGELEDLGLLRVSASERSSDSELIFYRREVTNLGKAVIIQADPVRLALVFEKYKMWHALAHTVHSCNVEQLPTFLVHEVKFVRSAAEHRFKRLTNGS